VVGVQGYLGIIAVCWDLDWDMDWDIHVRIAGRLHSHDPLLGK
jgi:hypothetical protein